MTIDHLAKLEAEMTGGKWTVECADSWPFRVTVSAPTRPVFTLATSHSTEDKTFAEAMRRYPQENGEEVANAAGIAAARNHLPALIRVARAAKELLSAESQEEAVPAQTALISALKELEEVKR